MKMYPSFISIDLKVFMMGQPECILRGETQGKEAPSAAPSSL